MRRFRYILLIHLLSLSSIVQAQEVITLIQDTSKISATDSLPQEGSQKEKEPKYKTYEEIITKDAQSDEGLFRVHKVDGKYYYEIPFNLLDKDMLLVSRIAKKAPGLGGGYTTAGSKSNQQLIRWNRIDDHIHLKSMSYSSVANDTLPIYLSVRDNNYEPVLAAFSIEGFTPDSTAALIEVSDLFLTDVRAISGLSERMRKDYKVKKLDKKRSFISRMSSFPQNVEVRHDMTFNASEPPENSRTGTISMQMSQSMYLLPEKPMQPRIYDRRVGWFTISQIDYGSDALKADEKTYIRRWNLVPKDIEAYKRGELVEPVEPIVYYLDPATPKKWRPYFRQGIEDWQSAFEVAGFKNAIIAKDAPTAEEDAEWSAEDARYSTVRYVATTTRNAMGPSVSDPRSGEIIESDIVWYHNHLRSYRNRYLLETGAANPSARTLDTPEAEIGEMMRMVISHEIGHALGLPHNMKASYAYPTDSLRSATFTQKWGLASTLMDYTRYNYVAQPGDTGVRWIRMLGPYDNYAINWGYRYIPDATTEEEKATLNQWILEKEGDPVYLFGGSNSFDPSSQTESVGDDPVKASTYGLSNLKIVASKLTDWTTSAGDNYEDLEELYAELIRVWSRYAGHVIGNIGGVYELRRNADEAGVSYTHLPYEEQQASMAFLVDHVFTTPTWLLQDEIINNISPDGTVKQIRNLHERLLNRLLSLSKLQRMIDNEAINGGKAYDLSSMMGQLRESIWSELANATDIDSYRRNLQRSHVKRLHELMKLDSKEWSDISSVVRAEMITIQSMARGAADQYSSGMAKYHLQDIDQMVDQLLDMD